VTAGRREPYDVSLTRTARRHLSESLLDVAIGASEFITGPLADSRAHNCPCPGADARLQALIRGRRERRPPRPVS
jgi:hypothetical protein